MDLVTVRELYRNREEYLDKEVTIGGWVRSIRDSKTFGFIVVNDGSFFENLQVVYHDNMENFGEISKLNVGAAIIVKGTLVATPQAKQPFEIQATEVVVEGTSAPDYPLQKKRHSMEYLRIGLITRPHGVHGALKVQPLSEDLTRYKGLREAYLERGGAYEKVEVSDVSVQPDAVYMTISVCRDRNTAETLRNHYISVDREHAVKLPEGRYFVADMIGCDVYDTNGAYYGKLTDVLETGANDVYVIQGEKQLMVPALRKLLKEVDVANKRIELYADVLAEVGLFED